MHRHYGLDDARFFRQALGASADDYLTKPFDPAEMLARMGVGRRIIELSRELGALHEKSAQDATWCAPPLGNRLHKTRNCHASHG